MNQFKPIIAFSLLALLGIQSASAQSGLTINSSNLEITNTSNVDTGTSLLTIDATQNLGNITINNGSGNAILSEASGAKDVTSGIIVSGDGATNLRITSSSQQAIIINANKSFFDMYDVLIANTSTTATLTFGAGVSLVSSDGGSATNTQSDLYGLSLGGRERLLYKFGSNGVVFEQVGDQSKNTASGGVGSNAIGIRVDNSADFFGKLTFSKILGGQGGDGESGVGGKAYGITATTNGRTLRVKEGARIVFGEIVGGNGGSSNGNIVGSGGEAGGILLEASSSDFKIMTIAELNMSYIDNIGRIFFESIQGGKSQGETLAPVYPINNKGNGTLELLGISIIVGEESEEDNTNYYGIRNKIENAQYNLGKTIIQGLDNPYGGAVNLDGLVLDKSAKIEGEVKILGGISNRDWEGNGLDGASVVGLTLKNSKITTTSGLKMIVAGGRGGEGNNLPNGKIGDTTGIKSLENSTIEGDLTIELAKVNEGSKSYVFNQFSMIDNHGVLTLTSGSVLSVGFATDIGDQVSRFKTLMAINNRDQITLQSKSAIRIGSGGDTITSGIYNNVGAKTIYNLGNIDVYGNDVQNITTGLVTQSSIQLDGVINVFGGQSKSVVGLVFGGGVSNALSVTANIFGNQENPVVGLVLGGGAELGASSMTLNLATNQNKRFDRSGNAYLAGIVLENNSAKLTSGIYTLNFPNEEIDTNKLFAIKNLSADGSLTFSPQSFVALGVENPSEVSHVSTLYDNVGYNYEFGNGNAKTIFDVGYRSNGLYFTKTIRASGNLEIQGSDERINGLMARVNDIGIISVDPLSLTINGRQAYAENGADVGRSVGINVAQGSFFLQGNTNGTITFNVNGGRDKEGNSPIGEAVGVLISGDAFSANEFSNFQVSGGEAYGVKLIGSAIRSHKVTLNLKEANFNGNTLSDGAITGSVGSYGLYNQGNTTLEGSVVFGNGSNASIGSSSTPQAYGLYNQSGILDIFGKIQFKENSILAGENGESGVIYNAGEIVFEKQSSIVFGNAIDSVQSNLWANNTYMRIEMLEGSSMLFFDKAFDVSNSGKIDINMGYNTATKIGAKLSFESDAGSLNTLSGKYAQIFLAGCNQTSINARKQEAFTPKILSIADMQLDESSFVLFANVDKEDSLKNGSDQIVILGSTLTKDTPIDNSLHIVLGDFKKGIQTPIVLAEVQNSIKDYVTFNSLQQNGEKVDTLTYSGFDTAIIEIERVEDTQGNAIYQSTLEAKNQSVNEEHITPTAAVLSTNFNLFSANLNSLNKRMGELRDDSFVHGVWARIFVGQQSSNFGVEATSIYTTAQMGYDYKIKLLNSNDYVGLALSYINSSTNQAVSRYTIDNLGNIILGINSATTNGVELALYNSYIADNGFYSDSVIKVSYLLSDVDMFEQNKEYTTKNVAFALSEEVGYRFKIGRDLEWIFEPQLELSYGYINAENFIQVLDGLTQSYLDSTQEAVSLLRSRIGMAWGYNFNHLIKKEGYKASLYLGTYYAFDYLVGGEVSYITNNNSQASYQAMKSNGRFVVNAGVNAELDKNTRIYFDFEKSFGNVMRVDYQLNFGVRVGFGADDKPKEESVAQKEQGTILKPASLQ